MLKALVSQPRVIIFDEPTSSLEAREAVAAPETIRRLSPHARSAWSTSPTGWTRSSRSRRVTVLRDGAACSPDRHASSLASR